MKNIINHLISYKIVLIVTVLSANVFVLAVDTPSVELKGKIKSVKLNSEDKSYISFDLVINMEFINKSDVPILLSKREIWLNSKFITSSLKDFSDKKYLYESTMYPSNYNSPKLEKYRQQINIITPPQEYFRYISPNNSWCFNIDTVIEIPKKSGESLYKMSWNEIKSSSQLWMQLEVNFWYSNIEPVEFREEKRFGKKLRKQWEKYGYLWLDDVKSEPILLDLKSLINKISKN